MTPPQMPNEASGETNTDANAGANQMTPPQMPNETSGETNTDANASTDTSINQFGNRGSIPNGFSANMQNGMDNAENQKNETILITVCIVTLIVAIVVVLVFKRRKYRS